MAFWRTCKHPELLKLYLFELKIQKNPSILLRSLHLASPIFFISLVLLSFLPSSYLSFLPFLPLSISLLHLFFSSIHLKPFVLSSLSLLQWWHLYWPAGQEEEMPEQEKEPDHRLFSAEGLPLQEVQTGQFTYRQEVCCCQIKSDLF